MTPLLEIESVSKSFGGLKALCDFSLRVPAGALYGLIGPNGAGKTTVFNLLTGVYRPDAGRMRLAEKSIAGLRTFEITRAGIARTFQNIRLFPNLSVLDNVKVACHLRARHTLAGAILRTRAHRADERSIAEHAARLLDLLGLCGREDAVARNLCYGDQRRLEIARALATSPRLLLLDEPAAGMNPQEKIALRHLIRKLRDDLGVTILLIEHDRDVVMGLCEKITVLDHGIVIAGGTPAEIQRDPSVIGAYLGTAAESKPGTAV